jgi:ribosomal protein S18 acetylase RimI-like enzyme
MFDGKRHMIGIWIFAEVDKTPAGFIGALVGLQKLFGNPQVVGNILNNGVSKDFRGMGIGTALYVKMLEEMRKWNTAYILDYMVMEDNAPERGLLQELGFKPAQKHVLLEKKIS